MTKVRKAVIPAAGLGTRFLPATKALAKEMLPIVDKPTIQFIVEEALKSGIEEILVVTGRPNVRSKTISILTLNWNTTSNKKVRLTYSSWSMIQQRSIFISSAKVTLEV